MNDVLVVCISRLYRTWMENHPFSQPTDEQILEMARWAWNCQRDPLPDLVFAQVGGEIKGVFVVDRWFVCGEAANEPDLKPAIDGIRDRNDIEQDIDDNYKMAFIGHVADYANIFIGGQIPKVEHCQTFCYVKPRDIILP